MRRMKIGRMFYAQTLQGGGNGKQDTLDLTAAEEISEGKKSRQHKRMRKEFEEGGKGRPQQALCRGRRDSDPSHWELRRSKPLRTGIGKIRENRKKKKTSSSGRRGGTILRLRGSLFIACSSGFDQPTKGERFLP